VQYCWQKLVRPDSGVLQEEKLLLLLLLLMLLLVLVLVLLLLQLQAPAALCCSFGGRSQSHQPHAASSSASPSSIASCTWGRSAP
jgi:hypothetical protein